MPVGDEEAFTSKVKAFLDNPAHLEQAKKDARAEAERYETCCQGTPTSLDSWAEYPPLTGGF